MLPALRHRLGWSAAFAVCTLFASLAVAQPELGGLFDSLELPTETVREEKPRVSATLTRDGDIVTAAVTIDVPAGGNIYSQDPSFLKPTKFSISSALGLAAVDNDFTPDHPPKRAFDENFGKEVEKFLDRVTFSRRYRLLPGASPETAALKGKVEFLYCKESCVPYTETIDVSLAAQANGGNTQPRPAVLDVPPLEELAAPQEAEDAPPPPVEEVTPSAAAPTYEPQQLSYRITPVRANDRKDPLTLQFALQPEAGKATISITMKLERDYRTYAINPAKDQVEIPTTIELTELRGLEPLGEGFQSTEPAKEHVTEFGRSNYYANSVTWTREYRVTREPVGAKGYINYQVCHGETECKPPFTVKFSLGSLQDPADVKNAVKATAAAASDVDASTDDSDDALATLAYDAQAEANSLPVWLALAFLGGLILNVMPCVLPVISIKVLSFVHQAGERPGRIFALNAFYGLGVLSVFAALATLALTLQLGWGGQNQSATYNIVMAAVVFAMGLSLLGVFEIPIPGMASGVGGKQHSEGLLGAFLTGILATLLATPCTGPYMATTLFWSLKQPVYVMYLVWLTMGLGMASPYLVIGCFPRLVDWLPRPGNWMVTFKQVCGFVLMGTAVWLLNTINSLNNGLTIPTLIILVGVAVIAWMVGSLYDLSSSTRRRWAIRGLSLATGGPIIGLGLMWCLQAIETEEQTMASSAVEVAEPHQEGELPWQPFSQEKLRELVAAGKPVLIDFTADWCAICKTNELVALNTAPTAEFIEKHGFVTLMADFTKQSPDIREVLNKFGQDSVPLTAIIPAGQPGKTKLLRSRYSQGDLLEKLEEAAADSKELPGPMTASTADKPGA